MWQKISQQPCEASTVTIPVSQRGKKKNQGSDTPFAQGYRIPEWWGSPRFSLEPGLQEAPANPAGKRRIGLRTRRPSAGQEGTRRGPQLRWAGSGRRDLLPSRLHSPESRQRGRRNTRPKIPQTVALQRLRQLHSGLTAPLPANCPLFPAAARVTGAAEAQKTLSAFFKDVFHWRTTKSRGELGPAKRKHRRGYTALEENE